MAGEIWGLLGPLSFKAIDSPDSFSVSESESFAEIPLLQSKPVMQWVGSDLREFRMSFLFDYGWCNPSDKLKQLQDLLVAHEPLAFSLGEGNYNGNYYLLSVAGSVDNMLPTGELLGLSVRVTLKETTDLPVDEEQPELIGLTNLSPKKSPFEQVR